MGNKPRRADPRSSGRPETLRTWLGRLALLLGTPLLLLGGLELVAWILGQEPLVDNQNYRNRASILECRFGTAVLEHSCRADRFREPFRRLVFVYGGSSVVGHKLAPRSRVTDVLQARLDGQRPGRYRTANLAAPCKNSFFIRQCVERTVEAGPDVIVIYSGHNDFNGLLSATPQVEMWFSDSGAWVLDLDRRLAGTRGYALVNRAAARPIALGHDPRAVLTPGEVARSEAVILEAYTRNLTDVFEQAAEHGAQVILVTLVSNLYEYPNRLEDWDELPEQFEREGLTGSPWAVALQRGVDAHRAGRFAEALHDFKVARDARPFNRAPGFVNDRIRELAAAYAHVHLVDFEALLDAAGAEEGIGCNFFGNERYCDSHHPNERAQRVLAEALTARILELE